MSPSIENCHTFRWWRRPLAKLVGAVVLVATLATVMSSWWGASTVRAQETWPTRPVTLVVPYTAGGFSDIVGRLFADFYSKRFSQPFVVENRPGGNGVVGAGYVASAQPDGYTILLTSAAQVVSIPLLQKVSYDPGSLVPISNLAAFPYLLGIKPSLSAKSVPEFIAYAKANPGKLNFASAGIGSLSHMMAAMFLGRAGVDVVHVPYKSANPAAMALLAGQVDMVFIGAAELMPHVTGDKVRVLATSAAKPLARLPDVPAVRQFYPGLQFETWNGLMAPRGTPQEILDKLTQASREAVKSPDLLARMTHLNIIPVGNTQAEFAQTLKEDKIFYPDAIKAAGIPSQLQ